MTDYCIYELIAVVIAHIMPVKINTIHIPVCMGEAHEAPPLAEEVLTLGSCLCRKS